MKIIKLVFKNALRHKLRTILTILGISIAVFAFGLLRTFVTSWHSGVDASAADRLIVRHAVSFIFPLPSAYTNKIKSVDEVAEVSYANWFGGTYIDKSNFFARMAVDVNTFFNVYPEFVLSEEELTNFKRERNSCVIGSKLAEQYDLEIGDIMTLDGDIYPGKWDFVIRGIYEPKFNSTDANQMFFHWEYLNERMNQESPSRANFIGWFIVKVANIENTSEVSASIDQVFKNSTAETKSETERAFQQGFLASTGAIISAMNAISFVIVGIIMLVLANTMIMAARERTREYAVLKALGFSGTHLTTLILGESTLISLLGGAIGLTMLFPFVDIFAQFMPKGFFPAFYIESITLVLCMVAVLAIGIASAIFPIQRAVSTRIVDGFRFVG